MSTIMDPSRTTAAAAATTATTTTTPNRPPTYAERKKNRGLRMRSDSSGSVRGAFYDSNDADAPMNVKQRKTKKSSPPKRAAGIPRPNNKKKETVAPPQFLTDRRASGRKLEPILDVLGDESSERGRRARDGLNSVTGKLVIPRASAGGSSSEIASFAALAMVDYSSMSPTAYNNNNGVATTTTTTTNTNAVPPPTIQENKSQEFDWEDFNIDEDDDDDDENKDIYSRLCRLLDPTDWLLEDSIAGDPTTGQVHFDPRKWTLQAVIRDCLYNPVSPEFSSLQQFCWAVLIGVAIGAFVSFWKWIIETGLDFMWETVPEFLLDMGLFTDLDGPFPLYHYCWICPAVWGGILSWIFVVSPIQIPDQNQWITAVHNRGVQDSSGFLLLFVLSTLAMMSGLSLGPELPLVLTAGMVGSSLGILCKQSMLQARVLNLTAAGAAVGGFFGFPMAGALFVLEIPHRMGLQYFEALSPATISSIVAVLTNRLIVSNDVTGYFSYPFLSRELPSEIFTSAIVYGLYGAGVGVLYAMGAIWLKGLVHEFFHVPHGSHDDEENDDDEEEEEEEDAAKNNSSDEQIPLVPATQKPREKKKKTPPKPTVSERIKACGCLFIKEEPKRAAVAGTLAGAIVGVIGMFVPHTLFWGEAQLQNLIDKGRTPLPVFGRGEEPTAALTAAGLCMIDPNDPVAVREGFSLGCSLLISVAKIATTGLSLGTGIIGGHFWGPLFVGCSASHFLTDLVNIVAGYTGGIGSQLSAYPCVVILCTMGSAHVVTFRAHMAIMLILTLTISAFDTENDTNSAFSVAGDYSAVFPLLVVSVFVSLMVSKKFVFYKSQRSRGDITAIPEVLCEPGMEGRPMVVDYENSDLNDDLSFNENAPSDEYGSVDPMTDDDLPPMNVRNVDESITQDDIEMAFERKKKTPRNISPSPPPPAGLPATKDVFASKSSDLSSARLDELLGRPMSDDSIPGPPRRHRRTKSAPVVPKPLPPPVRLDSTDSTGSRGPARVRTNSRGNLVRIDSFGEIQQHQPSLLDQARGRSASSSKESRHRRVSSVSGIGISGVVSRHRRVSSVSGASTPPRAHRRHPSLPTGRPPATGIRRAASTDTADTGASTGSGTAPRPPASMGGALSLDDIEQSFDTVSNSQFLEAMRNSFQ